MIANVRESKARLSELIAKASSGEEVVISVRGKPTIRLVPIADEMSTGDVEAWVTRRRSRLSGMPKKETSSSEEILRALREDRF